jgi:type VI secretion system protein ImpL
MKRIAGWLPVLLRLAGAFALIALVWFGGPLVAVGNVRPFETTGARVALIAVLLVAWVGRRALAYLGSKFANRRLFDALRGRDTGAPRPAEPQETRVVRERFEKAVALLRTTRLGRPDKPTWRERLEGRSRYVYQLPWYLFIGPPGSGKTTALLNAGLRFPLADRLGDAPVRGVGGTRHCDWWFTEQAVLIDTAGRYTTQDSEASSDANEWGEFIGSLRRFRPRQPINGVLVTISVADLLGAAPGEVARQANAVQARLDELGNALGTGFPVYVLVTKADLIAGFSEFFDGLSRADREQVWGTTFEFRSAAGAALDTTDLGRRLDELTARLIEQTPDRLQAERDAGRRSAIFQFPYQVAALKPALVDFFRTALAARPGAARPPMVRGVYLTSGTQEGSPIDRIMGSLGRQFGVQHRLVAPSRSSGRAYFLTRLMTGVIFAEAGLAGTNLKWERRRAAATWAIGAIAIAVGALAIAGWTASYSGNRDYVAEVQRRAQALRDTLAKGTAPTDLRSLLALYSAIRELPRTDSVDPSAPTLTQGLGLFQGEKLQEAAEQSYRRAMAQTLAPALAARLAASLRGSVTTPELRYETLKTYLMLHEPSHRDPAAIKAWLAFDLDSDPAARIGPEERKALIGHLDTMLAEASYQDVLTPDRALVSQAQATLAATPFAKRVYERLKRQGVGTAFPAFRVDAAAGPSAGLVFARRSGKPLTDTMPGLFTFDGYHKGFVPALDSVVTTLAAEEPWVLGIADSANARLAADPATRPGLAGEVTRLYLQEYASRWEELVADLTLAPSTSLAQTLDMARVLSSTDSPLPRLMRAIAREVTLAAAPTEPSPTGIASKANEAMRGLQRQLETLRGTTAAKPAPPKATAVESIVDDRFVALRRYVQAPASGAPAPVDQTVSLLGEVYQFIVAVDNAVKSGLAPPRSDLPSRVRADSGRMPQPARELVSDLAASGEQQALGATRATLGQELVASVTDVCRQLTRGRYPFQADSPVDVTPDDFARLFGPDGVLDQFFRQKLAPHVDTTVKPWRFRKVGEASMAAGASLVEFQRAAEIRNAFFAGAATVPTMRVTIKPVDMDPNILQFLLDVDGQPFRYAHGPAVPQRIQWPGPKGTGQIRVEVSPPGPSGTSGFTVEGPWALMRLFDRARVEPTPQPERFRATLTVDGRPITLEVTASSVQNPLQLPELRRFACPARL